MYSEENLVPIWCYFWYTEKKIAIQGTLDWPAGNTGWHTSTTSLQHLIRIMFILTWRLHVVWVAFLLSTWNATLMLRVTVNACLLKDRGLHFTHPAEVHSIKLQNTKKLHAALKTAPLKRFSVTLGRKKKYKKAEKYIYKYKYNDI